MTVIALVFTLVYVGMILGRFPFFKIGRPAIALVGAVFLLAGHEISGTAALDSVDFGTLGLLFGLMLLSIQFEDSGLYTWLAKLVENCHVTPFFLLGILSLLAGILSAFLTNDVIAVAMTPVILGLCLRRKLNPVPFLLALAFAANAGSVATLIGSPQNMLISQKLHLGFGHFLIYTAVPALLALLIGWLVPAWFQRGKWTLPPDAAAVAKAAELPEVKFNRFETAKALIVAGVVIGLFIFTDYDKGLIALTAGCFLLMNGQYDSRAMIAKIDWGLLLLFFGLFVVNAAMNSTGLPQTFVNSLKTAGFNLRDPVTLFVSSAVLSDVISNVPCVMLLLPYASDPLSGPMLVLASGLSSNMLIIGSLANIIVVDAAASRGLKISFWDFVKVGLPVSVVSMILGIIWVLVVSRFV